MKKIVPDPPHFSQIPEGTTLSDAIIEQFVPVNEVVSSITHYLLLAYNHSRYVIDSIENPALRESLSNGLGAMQIAWAQADALASALERQPERH